MSILTEEEGIVSFVDLIEGMTMRDELDEHTGLSRKVVLEPPEASLQPAIAILDAESRKPIGRYMMPAGAYLIVNEGELLSKGDAVARIPRESAKTKDITGGLPRVAELFEARKPKEQAIISEIDGVVCIWEPQNVTVYTEKRGKLSFVDIKGATIKEELDKQTGHHRKIVTGYLKNKPEPGLSIVDESSGEVIGACTLPVGANIMVDEGQDVLAGDVLVKIPRESLKSEDEVHVEGAVKIIGSEKMVVVDDGISKEYGIPRGKHITVRNGDKLKAGEPLVEGAPNPHDILNVLGEEALQSYLVNEVQEVYRLQGVHINDKHIEAVVRQMMRRISVEDPGDTDFLTLEQVSKKEFQARNEEVIAEGGKPAKARPLLLGITAASLGTDSFISAASFQETTKVLTQAAVSGKVDRLKGLKENVIMGRLIPAGTGVKDYYSPEIEEMGKDEEERGLHEIAAAGS